MSEVEERTRKLEAIDVWTYEGQIFIPYTYSAGAVGSRFLLGLRDDRNIRGTRCPGCERVYVPARSLCIECGRKMDEWVEVSSQGTLETWTAVNYKSAVHPPSRTPLIYGIIRLDGADTGLVHLLGEADSEKLQTGMRVEAVFEDERTGSILDIRYFKPA